MRVDVPALSLPGGGAMPVYGLGTWGIGGRYEADPSDDDDAIAALRGAIERGVTHIDTAEMYGAGHAEELVGRAIRGFDRGRLFLVSKALAHHLDRESLPRAAEASLRRLGTDHLDLYLVHHPSDEVPIAETMEAMDGLVRRGLVREVGVSNFSLDRLREAQAASPRPIANNQVHYSLCVREPLVTGLLAHCQATGVALTAWRPLDACLFDSAPLPALDGVAARYRRTRVQVALNWLLAQRGVAVLTRTLSPGHLEENLGALGWRLSSTDVERLRDAMPGQIACSPVYALR